MNCIYCDLERKFNREHVFSAGLGGDDDDYVLNEAVCESCNSAFSKLENELLRKSPIALARISLQPAGRDRGKKTKEPTYTTEATYIVDADGRMLESRLGAGFKTTLVPQLHVEGNSVYTAAADIESLRGFLDDLRFLVAKDDFSIIKKIKTDYGASYEVSAVKIDAGYEVGLADIMAKPPKGGLWLQIEAAESKIGNRFYLSNSGELTYKTAREETIVEVLKVVAAYFRKEGVFDVWEEATIDRPVVSVKASTDVAMMERAIAKIGVNFLAYIEGAEYVRNPGFSGIKDYILRGDPRFPLSTTEDPGAVQLMGNPPACHHALLLCAIPFENGTAMILMVMKLYGITVHKVCLAEAAPNPGWSSPKYFLINYVERKIRPIAMMDYIKNYCDPAVWC